MHLDKNDIESISAYLHAKGYLQAGDTIDSAETPGDGNMNYTLRVKSGSKSFILKQARPYVEKYPQIPAPVERASAEAGFYHAIQKHRSISTLMPKLLGFDEANHLLVLEDLGNGRDGTFLYKGMHQLSQNELEQLCKYLNALHNQVGGGVANEAMANRSLRALNHEHIFVYPFLVDNGFDLDSVQPGLQKLSLRFKKNELLKQNARQLGERYMQDATTLLHGDFYPGSWLFVNNEVKVIDPEFCFYGFAEFDLAVMKAHLMMAEHDEIFINSMFDYYTKPPTFDEVLFDAFTGIEIMRRLIGLAQLPLTLTLQKKEGLLHKAAVLLKAKIEN